MPQVFICYSQKDKSFTDKLVADLNRLGVDTWRDVDNIPGHVGSNTAGWRKAVDEGLRISDAMIVVLSPESVASQEVESEWNWFLAHGGPVYPLVYKDCDIPYRLMALQMHFVSNGYADQVASLAEVITGQPVERPTGGTGRRWWLPVGGVVLLAVVILIVLNAAGVFDDRPSTPTPDSTDEPGGDVTPTMPGDDVTPAVPGAKRFDDRGVQQAYIPAGEFSMGFDPALASIICEGIGADCANDTFEDEQPIHTVTLTSGYWMDVNETTNAQYQECVEADVCDPPDRIGSNTYNQYYGNQAFDNYPVIWVDWEQADVFCREWRGGRLPTEAEWEYAASGGQDYIYPWGNQTVRAGLLNYCASDCTHEWADPRAEDGYAMDTAPVGTFPAGASPFGINDMVGNVWEWVQDVYDFYPEDDQVDPLVTEGSNRRVRRGGSWASSAGIARLSNRAGLRPDVVDNDMGFRCVIPE